MGRSQALYIKAKKLIPGGTQLLSKRPEMFLPDLWPAYYSKAKGCQVTDLDDKRYTDMSTMGIGSCILGYADLDVNRAVKSAVDNGNMCTLNAPEEVELAQRLVEIHPWASMVRYARTGGESMAIAARIARAKTQRDIILFCGYHGWHDWYLSSNIADDRTLDGHLLPGLEPRGVPRGLKGSAIPFNYNDIKEFLRLMRGNAGKVAAVIMEPIRNRYPQKGFLETVRDETRKSGAVLIFDEITAGWRLAQGGAHLKFKIWPDAAVFAKGMSNGYPMAAVIGTGAFMEAAQETFISSTYWTERVGPVAALATIKKLKDQKAHQRLGVIGKKVQDGWARLAKRHALDIAVSGIYPLGHFSFNYKSPLTLKTLFTQHMLGKGFLASNAFYASCAHTDMHVSRYLEAVDETFAFISKVVKGGTAPGRYLKGPVAHSGFKRLA